MPSSSCSGRFHPRARLPQSRAISGFRFLARICFQTSRLPGMRGSPSGSHLQPGKQHQQCRGFAKHSPGGISLGFRLGKGLVDALQPRDVVKYACWVPLTRERVSK